MGEVLDLLPPPSEPLIEREKRARFVAAAVLYEVAAELESGNVTVKVTFTGLARRLEASLEYHYAADDKRNRQTTWLVQDAGRRPRHIDGPRSRHQG